MFSRWELEFLRQVKLPGAGHHNIIDLGLPLQTAGKLRQDTGVLLRHRAVAAEEGHPPVPHDAVPLGEVAVRHLRGSLRGGGSRAFPRLGRGLLPSRRGVRLGSGGGRLRDRRRRCRPGGGLPASGGLVIDFNLILPPNPLPVVQDGGGRDKAVPSGEGIGVVGLKIPHPFPAPQGFGGEGGEGGQLPLFVNGDGGFGKHQGKDSHQGQHRHQENRRALAGPKVEAAGRGGVLPLPFAFFLILCHDMSPRQNRKYKNGL